MMFPRRVPFIGEVPLPMISSCPRSPISPTRAQTFEVPMSSATMYFSSVLGMFFLLRHFHHHPTRESQIGVFDAWIVLRAQHGAQVAVLPGEVVRVRVDDGPQLAVVDRESARRDRPHFRDPRVELAIACGDLLEQCD